MKSFLFCLVLFVCSFNLCAQSLPWHQYQEPDAPVSGIFNVIKHEYTFSTEFELEWEGTQFARAMKSVLHLRSQYDVYGSDGELSCMGIGSWLPSLGLGWIYSWAADFSVYSSTGEYIGSFNGTLYTDAVAKFTFYDAEKNKVGVAYMDNERTTFSFHSPSNRTKKVLEVQRQNLPYQIDYWTLQIYEEDILPAELIQIFAIFACDRQNDFNAKSAY